MPRLLALLLAALACSASAQDSVPAPDDGDWVELSTSAVRDGGSFSEAERVRATERLRRGVLDQVCRNAEIPLRFDAGDGVLSGTGVGLRRALTQLPDGSVAVVDQAELSVGASHTFPITSAGRDLGGIGVFSRVEGRSMIVRPLNTNASCKELDTLFDVRDVKYVLPMRGPRLTEMKVGELWRIPMSLTIGHQESLGRALIENLKASLTFTGSEHGAATITLYRVSESQLRFRFRVDRYEVRTTAFRLVETLPAIAGLHLGKNILLRLLENEIADRLMMYTELSLDWSRTRSNGKKVLLEYVVDPRDARQAEAVAKAVRGDFSDLVQSAWKLASQQASDESTRAYYERLQQEHDVALGRASYAAMNEYVSRRRGPRLNLGLFGFGWHNERGNDRMTRLDDSQEQFLLNHAGRGSEYQLFDLPFIGPLVKNERRRELYVVTRAERNEPHGDPLVVLMQQHAFLRAAGSNVKESVDGYNELLSLAGAQRPGAPRNMALPSARFEVPRPSNPQDTEPGDHKGLLSFTLAVNQKGVREALSASAMSAALAVANAAPEWMRDVAGWLFANATISDDGRVAYDAYEASRAFGETRQSQPGGRTSALADLAERITDFIADLREARDAADNEARGAALSRMLSGRGRSKLGYEEAMKVFVQLVDPLDLRGEFVSQVRRPKQLGNVDLRLALRKDRDEDVLLRAAAAAKNRFAEPSVLVD